MVCLIVNDFKEPNIGVLDGHWREHEHMTSSLLEIDELHASAVSHQHESILKTRSWNQLHSQAQISGLNAWNLRNFGSCIHEAIASWPLNDGKVIGFQYGDEESVALVLNKVVHSVSFKVRLRTQTDRMLISIV